jgi:membrane protein
MAGLKERVTGAVGRARERHPVLDHVVRTVQHYGKVKGNVQAGAVTFFGFLSFFPILALAFFVIGWIAKVYPDAQEQLVKAIGTVLPGMIGDGEGQISLTVFQKHASTVGVIGLAGVLYSGLGWLSGMRDALLVMFEMPERERPNFVVGKLRDLISLTLIGITLIVSVALSGAITGFSETILRALGIYDIFGVPTLTRGVGYLLAIAATTALFMALFRLLARPPLPQRALLHGAVLGALGFELLKFLANTLIQSTQEQPAFAVFGVALILLVWINYFSRLVMLAAAWTYTDPVAEDVRELEAEPLTSAEEGRELMPAPASAYAEDPDGARPPVQRLRRRRAARAGVVSGAAALVGGLTWLSRRRQG